MKVRYISQRLQKSLLNIGECTDSIEKMFRIMCTGDYVMAGKNENSHGAKIRFERKNTDKKNLYISMPGYLGGEYNLSAVKWHGPNIRGSGIAETSYTLIINDPDTGYPIGILPANLLTTYRTAATSVYAARLLKREKFEQVGIIGPGKINTVFLQGILEENCEIRRVRVKGRSQKSTETFINHFKERFPQLEIKAVDSFQKAVEGSDLISVITGFEYEKIADMPIIREKWLQKNALVLCPSFIKFSDNFLVDGAIKVADNYKMYQSYLEELGYPVYKKLSNLGNRYMDLIVEKRVSEDEIVDVFDILQNKKQAVLNQDKSIVFSSGGMITEDIAVGYDLLKKAEVDDLGSMLEI